MDDWDPNKVGRNAYEAANIGIAPLTPIQAAKSVDVNPDLAEVKQEPDIKEEPQEADEVPLVSTPHQQIAYNVSNIKIEPVADDFINGLRNNAYVKPEPKVDKVGKADENKLRQRNGSGTGKKNNGVQWNAKDNRDGHKTLAAKLQSIDAKGRARSVIVAAQKKRSAAKRTKKRNECSTCGYVAPTPALLKMHIRKHSGEKPFACNICTKSFCWKYSLQVHLRTHTDEYPFNCSVCLEKFARSDEWSEHEVNCNGRHFECHLCKKCSTPMKSRLKRHMHIHTGYKPFQCNLCSKRFKRKDTLNAHLKVHTKTRPVKFRCSVCALTFPQEAKKDQHELMCKWRRYECYLCRSYLTHDKSAVMSHMQANHTGVNPFQCNQCQKCFYNKSNLNRHVKMTHKWSSKSDSMHSRILKFTTKK